MAQISTDILINAKAKGFREAQSAAAKFTREAAKGSQAQAKATKSAEKELKRLGESMGTLTAKQVKLSRQMEGVKKGSAEYKKLNTELKGVNQEYTRMDRTARKLTQVLNDQTRAAKQAAQAQAKGSFTQGFLQGAVPGAGLIQRGPGAFRQAAGTMAGQTVSGARQSITGGAFRGVGGVVQGISQIPGAGFIAGQLQSAAGFSQRALGLQRQRLGMAPQLRGPGAMAGLQGAGRAGRNLLGIGREQSEAMMSQILQVGGGGFGGLQPGFTQAAMGAQQFGATAGQAGAFLQAGRRGGLVGGRGRGAEEMTEAIGDAMRLGLEGSEITDYLQTMSQGIQEWRTTGIPFNRQSLADMTQQLSATGLGGVRAANVGGGIQAAAKRIGTQGPQSGLEQLMLRTLGGFQGGGFEELEMAMQRMQEGQFEEGGMQRLFEQFREAGGGGAGGRFAFRQALGQMGVSVGIRESKIMEARARGEEIAPEDKRFLEQEEARRAAGAEAAPKDPAAMAKRAREGVKGLGPALQRQADIQNQQLVTGMKVLGVVQDLEATSSILNTSLITTTVPYLEKMAKASNEFAEKIPGAIKDTAKAVEDLKFHLGEMFPGFLGQ